jgi:hypothetical protein
MNKKFYNTLTIIYVTLIGVSIFAFSRLGSSLRDISGVVQYGLISNAILILSIFYLLDFYFSIIYED